tara:strand:- start:18142 stop:19035 length:894 start_codon:yes stop_codon:yes gene_type:complete
MRFITAIAMALSVSLTAINAHAEPPERILSVGGAVTETVFALGAGKNIVAVDQTSYYPWAATHTLPNVGYVRALAAEGLLSLKSDILIAGPEAGPPEILEQVSQAGLKVVQLKEGYSPEIAIEHFHQIGKALDREKEADELATTFAKDLETVKAEIAKSTSHSRVLFLLSAGRGAPMAGGERTAADAMIKLAGGVNAASAIQGYKPLSPEAAIGMKPDILMMMTQTVEALGGANAVMSAPEIAHTRAAQNKRLIIVDGLYTLGFGPRTAHALRDLAIEFHPGTSFTPLPERPWTAAK